MATSPPRKIQTKAAVALRRIQVERMLNLRTSLPNIAKQLGVALRTIERDAEILRAEWKRAASEERRSMRARELNELEAMERDAALLFEQSKTKNGADIAWLQERLRIKVVKAKMMHLNDEDIVQTETETGQEAPVDTSGALAGAVEKTMVDLGDLVRKTITPLPDDADEMPDQALLEGLNHQDATLLAGALDIGNLDVGGPEKTDSDQDQDEDADTEYDDDDGEYQDDEDE